jgi:hypothetical protein
MDDRHTIRDAAQNAVTEAIRAAIHREVAELRVMADEPAEFLAKLDKFYSRWPAKMAAILRPAAGLCQAARIADCDPQALAVEHCRTTHEAILELSGTVTAAELRDRIAAEVADWEDTIPAKLAATIFGGSNDGQ